jgi:hypothetical protein
LLGFLGRFLSEIRCPLIIVSKPKGQENGIPDYLDTQAQAENRQTDV